MTRLLAISSLLASIASPVTAQIVTSQNDSVQTTNRDTRSVKASVGTSVSIPLTVDTVDSSDLFDIVSTDPAVVISLILPNGVQVNAGNAATLGFTFTVMSASPNDQILSASPFGTPGTHTIIGLAAGSPFGVYQVRADASMALADAVVIASYFSSSNVRTGIVTDAPVYRIGDTVILSVLVFDGSTAITNASATARIGFPADLSTMPTEIVLQDSGTFDAQTGDGIYTGQYTVTAAGTVTAAVRVTGSSNVGVPFSRAAATTFQVIPPRAAFVSFSDAGADDDGNGLIDRVVVSANVDVQTAGQYQFGVTVTASNGAKINGSTIAPLQSGSAVISVSFPVAAIRRLGVDGPYTLNDAILTYRDDPEDPIADFRDPAGTTAAYPAASLDQTDVPGAGVDVTAPVIGSVANLTANATSDAGAVVTFDLPSVADDFDLAPNVSAKPSSGSQFHKGLTTVTVTATDAARHSSTATFTVNVTPWLKCDPDGDGRITAADLQLIRNANGQLASGPDDARDGNGDGSINIADVRYCQLRQTP
jgi:hypothetical protein